MRKELKEIDRWVELYETHDKYKFVGHLVDDPVDDILENNGEEDKESGMSEGGNIEGEETVNDEPSSAVGETESAEEFYGGTTDTLATEDGEEELVEATT